MIRSALLSLAVVGGAITAVGVSCDPRKPGPEPTPIVTPTPTPTPDLCPGEDPPRAAARLSSKRHGWTLVDGEWQWLVDSTPLVYDAPYCWAVYGEPLTWCAVRPEGDPDRAACEATLGPYTLEGDACIRLANPLQFGVRAGGWCRLCADGAGPDTCGPDVERPAVMP